MTRIHLLTAALAALAAALLAFATAAPAALASGQPPPHLPPGHIHQPVHQPPVPVPAHTVVIGGMPGWQIALIAVGAALAAAAVATLVDRAWAARKTHPTTA
jgi:hypothetical protein